MVNTEFMLHELAVEDAVHKSQRPKLDRYATHPAPNTTPTTLPAVAKPANVTSHRTS